MPSEKELPATVESGSHNSQDDVLILKLKLEADTFKNPQDLDDKTSIMRVAFEDSLQSDQHNREILPQEQKVSKKLEEQKKETNPTSSQPEASCSRATAQTTSPLVTDSVDTGDSETPSGPISPLDGQHQERHVLSPAAEISERDLKINKDPFSRTDGNPTQGLEDASASHDTSLPAIIIQELTPERPATTSPSIIKRTKLAPPKPTAKPQEEECSICQNCYTSRSTLKPCGHLFDFGCIMTWLEEVFRSKYYIAELKCPLCRSIIHTIQEDGALQPFDVARHFRELARRESRSRPLPGTIDELIRYFIRGGSGASHAGPSTLYPRQRESITLFDPRQQFQNDPWYEAAQYQALVDMIEKLRLLQELEDMGEGASTDLEGIHIHGRLNGPGRVERDYLQYSPRQNYYCMGQTSRLLLGYEPDWGNERWKSHLRRDVLMAWQLCGPHQIQPWREALRERDRQQELARAQEMFSRRLRRAVEEELRADSFPRGGSSTNGGVERPHAVLQVEASDAQQGITPSQHRNGGQPSPDSHPLTYYQQFD